MFTISANKPATDRKTKTLPNHRSQHKIRHLKNHPSSVPNIHSAQQHGKLLKKCSCRKKNVSCQAYRTKDLKFGTCQRAADIQNAPRAVPAGTARLGLEREDGLHATIEFFLDQAKMIVL